MSTRNRSARTLSLALAALVALAAQASVAGISTAPAPTVTGLLGSTGGLVTSVVEALLSPLAVLGMPDKPASGSAVIDGSVGGQVSAGPWTVTVPAGAWSGPARVTVNVPTLRTLRCDLSIDSPDKNHFAVPVQLACNATGVQAFDPFTLVMAWQDPVSGKWVKVTGTREDNGTLVVTAPLAHFSSYGVCGGKAGW